MPSIQEMLLSDNKGLYLFETINDDLYHELDRVSKDARQTLAIELVNERHQYPFVALVSRLTDICFKTKGAEFIRYGSSDTLGELLKQLVIRLDGHQITDIAFIDSYQPDKEVSSLFTIIHDKARSLGEEYSSKLPQNIANKIYNNILIDQVDETALPQCARDLQTWVKDSEACNAFFNKLIDRELLEQKRQSSINSLLQIKEKLKGPWHLGPYSFFTTRREVMIDGERFMLPGQVCPLANILLACEREGFKNPAACLRSLQQQAAAKLRSAWRLDIMTPGVREFMKNLVTQERVSQSAASTSSMMFSESQW
ncbi:hypothetical protein [Legionella sp. CNM-4043-24]|uniref:hypothetical protein n=1 Tax=Legionella sp. CNM-4043-24 TaxID=3421646 RepID=UPI00403AD657